MKSKIKPFVSILALCLAVSACTPMVETHGNLISESKVAKIHPAISTRAEVASIWGPPTTIAPFDPNVWYYIGETTSQKGVFEAEVIKRQTIRVTFGPDDLVEQVAALDATSGKEIAFIDRKTPTAGKEFTAFQQFIGNLGKFNTNE